MNTRQAYNNWASQYDTNKNRTRDREAQALRATLSDIEFTNCLEIGCGTGKNTLWLVEKATHITAIDVSDEMLAKAKEKIYSDKVEFVQADIIHDWAFVNESYDLVTFSLVLEHIEILESIFRKAAQVLVSGGYVYVGELHPYKQYAGTKAKFDTEEGQQVVDCFNHNLSDFTQAARQNGFMLVDMNEYFDNDDRNTIPRILTILFRKN